MTFINRNTPASCDDRADYEASPGEYWVEFFYRASNGRGFIRDRRDYYQAERAEQAALAEVEERRWAVGAIITCTVNERYVRRCGTIPLRRDVSDAR